MGLHSIIEPAGTLLMGWELVPDDDCTNADLRNRDKATATDPSEGDRSPPPPTTSKWELREVG